MNRWYDTAWLFAERSSVDRLASRMADGFRGDRPRSESGQLIAIVVGMIVVVLIVWILSSFSERPRRVAAYRSPRRLFLALAKAHRLTWRETWLLWRLARWHELNAPARIFLEPERFEREGLSRWLDRRAARLESLRTRLFAGLPEPQAQPVGPAAAGGLGLPILLPDTETMPTDLVRSWHGS